MAKLVLFQGDSITDAGHALITREWIRVFEEIR